MISSTVSSEAPARPLAVLVAGPLHLFRTTGIYLLNEMVKAYDVILVGEETYPTDPDASKAMTWVGVRAVHLMASFFDASRYHRRALEIARAISKAAPAILLQHNESFPHNLYFIAHVPSTCLRATFANGFTLDLQHDFDVIEASRVQALVRRFPISMTIARRLLRLRGWIRRIEHYTLLPLRLSGRRLSPPLDPMTGMRLFRDTAALTDVHFIFTEREAELYGRYLSPGDIQVVLHPVQQAGKEVHRLISAPDEQSRITLRPTWGLVSQLSARLGAAEAADRMARDWVGALAVLRERLGGLPACIKLHPLAKGDPAMQAMVAQMKDIMPDLEVIDPRISAERLILQSFCVVGDVSSVLWWSSMLGNRIVISLDAWGLPLGDEFMHHRGVIYVREPASLGTASLAPDAGEARGRSLMDALEAARTAKIRAKIGI